MVALICYHPADTLVTEQCAGSASILCVLLLDVDTPPLSHLLCLEVVSVSAAEPEEDIRTCLVFSLDGYTGTESNQGSSLEY